MHTVWNDERGVSPVVAVVLMVAISVVLSAAVGVFLLDLGDDATGGSQQSLGVRTAYDGNNASVQVVTGEADELRILINGSEAANLSNPSAGDTLSVAANESDEVTIVSVSEGDVSVVATDATASNSGSLAASPGAGPAASLTMLESFEDGDISNWDTSDIRSSSFTVSNTAYNGSYSVRFDHNDDADHESAILTFAEPVNGTDYSFWVYRTGDPNDDMVVKWRNGSSKVFGFIINRQPTQDSDESIHVIQSGGPGNIDTNANHGSGWHRYRFHDVDFATGTMNYTVRQSDGTVVTSGSASFNASHSQVTGIIITGQNAGGTAEYYYDDFYAGDGELTPLP